tara:strand:+ start:157 stop:597 length:441 start_codon:yes stop_codon:yes gene_type:complete
MFQLLGMLLGGIKDHLGSKQKLKKIKLDGELKILEAQILEQVALTNAKTEKNKQGQIQNYDLDFEATKNMKDSIKDEIVLAIFLIPLIMAFIPSLGIYVENGFKAIENMPFWYKGIIIGMVVVIYGMRGMLNNFLKAKNYLKTKKL